MDAAVMTSVPGKDLVFLLWNSEQFTTKVANHEPNGQVPLDFALLQNYPNPLIIQQLLHISSEKDNNKNE
jgi:hypothetical protein